MLTEFCQENALVIANTLFQEQKRRLYTWTSPDGQCWNQTDYIFCRQRWRSSTQSAKTRPGTNCDSDHELPIPKFRFHLQVLYFRVKANSVLPREHTGQSKHPFPTTQEKTLHLDITRWSTPKSHRLYSLQPNTEKLYTVSKNKTRSGPWLRS